MDALLSAAETAARLRISIYTLRYLRQQGRFPPAIKVGRRLLWDERDIVSWLYEQREADPA